MKLMRLAMCVAVFALVGGKAIAEDVDVQALQAKLAAQEARLNDLQAKMYGTSCEGPAAPEGITSLRKNAVVTIGGFFNTRYYVKKSELKSSLTVAGAVPNATNRRDVISKGRMTDMTIGDTVLQVKIDVNDNFDAFAQFNFNDSNRYNTGPAQNYWMRWKNINCSGFGILVGRDSLKFGGIQPYGFFDSFGNGYDDATGDAFAGWGDDRGPAAGGAWWNADGEWQSPDGSSMFGEGMFWDESSIVPAHTIWNNSRTIQVNPYWENQDGSLKIEASWFQLTEYTHENRNHLDRRGFNRRTSKNYGMGSFTGRVTWKPIEGLTLVASAINQHANNGSGKWSGMRGSSWIDGPIMNANAQRMDVENNNFATNLAFEYRPCFFNKLNVFASWTHGWNENWIKDQDSDSINAGFGIDFTDQLTWYVTGDYLRVKNDQGFTWHKGTGLAAETGFTYTLPYGVNFQVAYRHDTMNFKNRAGVKHTKYKSDMFVTHVGFNF